MATARTRTAPAPAKTRTSRATRSAERNAEARANLTAVPPAADTKPAADSKPAETQPAPAADPTKITASVALQPIAKTFYRPQIVASDGTVIAECPHMARYGHDTEKGARACFRSLANGAGWKIDNGGLADGDVLAPDLTAPWQRQEDSPRNGQPA